jgi:hypothetical protein
MPVHVHRTSRGEVKPYIPMPAQVQAHRSPADVVLYGGGYGAGKTAWLVHEMLAHAVRAPGVPYILASPSYPIMTRTLQPTLVEWLPGATRWPRGTDKASAVLGPLVKDWSAAERVLTLWNGTPVYMLSVHDPGAAEGITAGALGLDEPRLITHEAWRILNGRIRHPDTPKMRRSISGVPVMGWMFEEFGRGLPGREYIRASSRDNVHLPRGFVEGLNLSGKLAQAYIEGRFVSLEGVVYGGYEPHPVMEGDDGSVIDVMPEAGRETYGALDFGHRRPAFSVVQRVPLPRPWTGVTDAGRRTTLPSGTLVDVVVEEVVLTDTLEPEHASRCADVLQHYGLVMDDCWCDPAGDTANAQTGLPAVETYEAIFRDRGVLRGSMRWSTDPISRRIRNGVEVMNTRLLDHMGARRLLVAEHLTRVERTRGYPDGHAGVHDALQGYSYPKNRPHSDEPDKDGRYDHACDKLRYLMVGLYGVLEGIDLGALAEAYREDEHVETKPDVYRYGRPDSWI